MDYKTLKEAVKSLLNDYSMPEDAEKIGRIAGMIDEAEKDYMDLADSKNELRKKYVEAVRNNSFPTEKPEDEIEKSTEVVQKSFEECLDDATSSEQ